jgi:hypothetical protein
VLSGAFDVVDFGSFRCREPGDCCAPVDHWLRLIIERDGTSANWIEHVHNTQITVVAEDQFWMPGRSIAGLTALVERRSWVQSAINVAYFNAQQVLIQPGRWMRQLGMEPKCDRELWLGQDSPKFWAEHKDALNEHIIDAVLIGWWYERHGESAPHGCAKAKPKAKRKPAPKPRRAPKAV